MAKGIIYGTHSDLQKALNLPEHIRITNVIHNPKTEEFEFVLYTPDEFAGDYMYIAEEGCDIRRKRI
jgi:hypothetical protein